MLHRKTFERKKEKRLDETGSQSKTVKDSADNFSSGASVAGARIMMIVVFCGNLSLFLANFLIRHSIERSWSHWVVCFLLFYFHFTKHKHTQKEHLHSIIQVMISNYDKNIN